MNTAFIVFQWSVVQSLFYVFNFSLVSSMSFDIKNLKIEDCKLVRTNYPKNVREECDCTYIFEFFSPHDEQF